MKKKSVLSVIYLFFGIVICYLAARWAGVAGNAYSVHWIMAGVLPLAVVWFLWPRTRQETWDEKVFQALIAAGIILRVGYMLYTGCTTRGHDLRDIDLSSGGHAAYLLTLIRQGQLPQSNELQFYQQPFFYLTGSAVSVLVNGILQCKEDFYLVDAAKIISCFASCIVLFCVKPLCRFCGIKEWGRVIAAAVISFLPGAYLAGGRVNCDSLVYGFMTVLFLQTLRFEEKPDWKNTILLAVTYGLALMTKISCGLMALFTAAVFLKELIRRVRQGKWLPLGVKYLVFALISFPLGLWYSVRNYIRFGQPLTYVLALTPEHRLYRGNVSFVQRFLIPDIGDLLKTPYADPWTNYNFPVYFLKTALFGEFTYQAPVVLPVLLLLCGLSMSVFVVMAVYEGIRTKKMCDGWKYPVVLFLLFLSAAISFYLKEPYGCSMDYRYSLFLTVPSGLLLGKYYMETGNEKRKRWIGFLTAGFACCSAAFCLWIR